jgi:anti-anti-sigma regulatory factor
MTKYVDRDAGFATFSQGRSFCVRLDGQLDGAMARGIEARIRDDRVSTRLRLECSTLDRMDTDAARSLARALLAWGQARPDRSVEILNLDPAIAHRMARHPLRPFLDPDELVFIDPDRDTVWDTTPSRH